MLANPLGQGYYFAPQRRGAIAQLGERLHGMQEVSGSIPLGSTKTPISLYTLNVYELAAQFFGWRARICMKQVFEPAHFTRR